MSLSIGKTLRPVLIIATALLIAIGLYLTRPAPKEAEVVEQTLLINAAKAVKQDIRIRVRAQGTVSPRTQTQLVAEVTGRVTSVSDVFIAGGYFQQGDELLRIDQRDYIADVKRAEAAVASARSELATEKGQAEVAYQDWVKYRSDVKRSEAATNLALRKPQLDNAEAKLTSALADLDHARDQLDRTIIRAPYDGIIKTKSVDIGQFVNVGTEIGETFAIDVAEIRLALPPSKLNYLELPTLADSDIRLEPRVDLYAEIGEELHQWQGHIVRTEGIFDERSRVLFAVAEIKDPYGLQHRDQTELRIGTFVDANIEGRIANDVVVLPRHLLRSDNRLWVINSQQRLENRRVSILRTDGKFIFVTQGIEDGELISLTNVVGVAPGSKINIAEVTPTSELYEGPPLPESPPASNKGLELAPATKPKPQLETEVSHKGLSSSLNTPASPAKSDTGQHRDEAHAA